jgi:hypothetical protein
VHVLVKLLQLCYYISVICCAKCYLCDSAVLFFFNITAISENAFVFAELNTVYVPDGVGH